MLKRVVDISISSLLILILSLPILLTALAVRLTMGSPVLFRQVRPGHRGLLFDVLKFRTMTEALDSRGQALADELRLTPTGRFLRRASLDELPQLWNVLRGDMSLVGPRPCLRYETELFEPHHFERFTVPAGMTGLWQVTARSRSTFVEALEMDVAYARGWSLGLDLYLLARTPLQLLTRRGVA